MAEENGSTVTDTESSDTDKSVPQAEKAITTTEPEVKEQVDAASEKAATPEPKKVDPRQRKIAELAYQNRELERRFDRMLSLVEQQIKTKPTAEQPPKLEDYQDIGDYVRANYEYLDKQKAKPAESRPNPEQEEYQSRVQYARQELIDSGSEKYEDFEDVVTAENVKITPVMRDAIFSLDDPDVKAELTYYLGKNPKESARISKLEPIRQVAEIGKLEAKLSLADPQAKRPSKAPSPINPVGGGSTAPNDIIEPEMSFEKFMKVRNKQLGRK